MFEVRSEEAWVDDQAHKSDCLRQACGPASRDRNRILAWRGRHDGGANAVSTKSVIGSPKDEWLGMPGQNAVSDAADCTAARFVTRGDLDVQSASAKRRLQATTSW